MKKKRGSGISAAIVLMLLCLGCSRPAEEVTLLRHVPLDGLEEILTRSQVVLDEDVSTDSGGSIRIHAPGPMVVRLVEVPIDGIDNARLIYQARLKSRELQGQAYLEMLCVFPDKGEFFSRGLDRPLSGTTEWVTEQTPFFLKKKEAPSLVKLNLVVTGQGVVWVDDIRLLLAPLN